MTANNQRYTIIIRAIVDESITAESRHARFFERIRDLPAPWGGGDRAVPRPPNAARPVLDIIGFKKYLGVPGIKIAEITYVERRRLTDDGDCDDAILIDFDPAKLDYHLLVRTVLPRLVEAFDGYHAICFDEDFVDDAYEVSQVEGGTLYTPKVKENINPRYQVDEAYPICYFSETLCRRAFDLTPAEVLARVKPVVESARLLDDGVYIVGSSEVIAFDVAQSLSQNIYEAIVGKNGIHEGRQNGGDGGAGR